MGMKVLSMIKKIEYLKRLRDDLRDHDNKEDFVVDILMTEAADAIDDYIIELYNKDVKV